MSEKNARAAGLIQHQVAEFLGRESNRTSLITVTRVDLSPDMGKAIVFVTVYPDDKTKGALDFLARKRDDVKDHIKQHSRLRRIPRISFEIDYGEKNRQHIDEMLAEDGTEKK